MADSCPVCAAPLGKMEPRGDATYYSCPRCGQFVLSNTLIATLPGTLEGKEEKIAILSHVIRKMQKKGGEPFLDTDFVKRIMKTKLPNPSQQADNFILWLGEDLLGPGERIWVEGATHQSIIGAKSPNGFALVVEHLLKKELLTGVLPKTMGRPGLASVTLSMEGWDYFEELIRGAKDSRKAFMAMKFGDETLDMIVGNYFKPAVEKTGFQLRRLNDLPRAGLIDDRLRVEILLRSFNCSHFMRRRTGHVFPENSFPRYRVAFGVCVDSSVNF